MTKPLPRVVSVKFAESTATIRLKHSVYEIDCWPTWTFSSLRNGRRSATTRFERGLLISILQSFRTSLNQKLRGVVSDLLSELPLRVHSRMVLMHHRYWAGVEFLARHPQYCDLAVSAPGLFAALATRWCAKSLPELVSSQLDGLDRLKIRSVSRLLGFGESDRNWRVLNRLERLDLTASEWTSLARSLRCRPEVPEALSQFQTVSEAALQLLIAPNRLSLVAAEAIPKFVSACAGGRFSFRVFRKTTFWELCALFARRGLLEGKFVSLDQATVWVDSQSMITEGMSLAVPEFEGLKSVTPILTVRALIEEGKAMRHCAGKPELVFEALLGKASYWSVLSPERATVRLRRVECDTGWMLDEVSGMENSRPSAELILNLVQEFGQCGVGLSRAFKCRFHRLVQVSTTC